LWEKITKALSNLKPPDHLSKPLQHLCPHPLHKLDAPDNEMPAAADISSDNRVTPPTRL
jgi:hypothetical protein